MLTHLLHLYPPLNIPIPPNLFLTFPISNLHCSKCFEIQYEHNRYIVLIQVHSSYHQFI